jgi:O-acetyl-ADP-ribose deacetylase (regulator of RNase III)
MVGTYLPYFPVSGPVPKLPKQLSGSANTWGGMEIGANQMYAIQVVDGHVTELGGFSLKKALQALPIVDVENGYRCLVGSAVVTKSTEGLQHNFKHIIHTVPPFYSDRNMTTLLQSCYTSALDIAVQGNMESLLCPLLGSGARGIPHAEAAAAAVNALTDYPALPLPMVFKFGLMDGHLLKVMDDCFSQRKELWERVP